MDFSIDLENINLEAIETFDSHFNEVRSSDIAIIGMSGKFGAAENLEEFWHSISRGSDMVDDVPITRRKDIEDFLRKNHITSYEYAQGSFFNQISNFDYDLFGLSPREAALIDPNQRLLLREVWKTLENAGYGGNSLKGSQTGVFIGFSSDFGNSYKDFISTNAPDALEMSLAGNIKSVIAGRVSYSFDLKGPAISIDTACSSALVAIHEAAKAIINGECNLSIVGSIKLTPVPVRCNNYTGTGLQHIPGVESEDSRTRTFDNTSTGTGMGEGVGVLLLKPLSKAISDKDNVLAVIKGSAVNQDGASLGITAPNSLAQKEVIINAWKDAEVSPDTISYIEAHGTGTKLGDPIEIDGIQKAFEEYTMQKQFCAIGSVKSNIGHLDHAAGIAGLIKVILSLKNKQIPPLAHFLTPNRRINFINSPVFINKKLSQWHCSDNIPRRAGISAFGLSGTNCHMILEESPIADISEDDVLSNYFLPLSAKTQDGLLNLIKEYKKILEQQDEISLSSLTKTASVGRGHYNYRLFLIFKTRDELIDLLDSVQIPTVEKEKNQAVYFGYYSIYQTPTRAKLDDEISYEELDTLSRNANHLLSGYGEKEEPDILSQLASFYIQGADIEWNIFFNQYSIGRMNLPTYPFDETACWVSPVAHSFATYLDRNKKEIAHPLVDRCELNYDSQMVYSVDLTPDKHWELSEHQVQGEYVLPGTAYIQMVVAQMQHALNSNKLNLSVSNLYFMHRFALSESASKTLKTLINKKDDIYSFKIVSYDEYSSEWILHAEGEIEEEISKSLPSLDLAHIKEKLVSKQEFQLQYITDRGLSTGRRWQCNQGVLHNNSKTEYLSYLKLDSSLKADLDIYSFHPALADCAINAINFFIGEDLYLPFSYKKIHIYKELPSEVYGYFKLKHSNQEIYTFDVTLIDVTGVPLVQAIDYSIKRVSQINDARSTVDINKLLHFEWIKAQPQLTESLIADSNTLIICKESDWYSKIINSLRSLNNSYSFIFLGNHYEKINEQEYTVANDKNELEHLLNELLTTASRIIFISSNSEQEISSSNIDKSDLLGLFKLVQAMLKINKYPEKGIYIAAQQAFQVNGNDPINPFGAALLTLANNMRFEYPKLNLRLFNFDKKDDFETIFKIDSEYSKSKIITIQHNTIYEQKLTNYNQKNLSVKPVEFKENNIYLITGGLGGVGLEIAKYLSEINKCKLILISRRSLPPKEEWKQIIHSGQDEKITSQLQALSAIESKGSEVILFSADVSSEQDMRSVIDEVYSQFKAVNGIFHCAGIAGKGYLINKSQDVFVDTIKPKIDGSILLGDLAIQKRVDFITFFSSVNAFIPEYGQTDYASANAFMDAYAAYLRSAGVHAISFNWPAWKETGMAVDHNVNMYDSPFLPISTINALHTIEKAIGYDISSAITLELNHEYIASNNYKFPFATSDSLENKKQKNIRTMETETSEAITLRGCNEVTEIMQKVGTIWGDLLGLKEIDIHESFYNLGGNSVMATSMLKKYEKTFPDLVDIADVFTYITIFDMNNYISSHLNIEEKANSNSIALTLSIEDILNMLSSGEITTVEADELMKNINL